jgi:hypothetical protein
MMQRTVTDRATSDMCNTHSACAGVSIHALGPPDATAERRRRRGRESRAERDAAPFARQRTRATSSPTSSSSDPKSNASASAPLRHLISGTPLQPALPENVRRSTHTHTLRTVRDSRAHTSAPRRGPAARLRPPTSLISASVRRRLPQTSSRATRAPAASHFAYLRPPTSLTSASVRRRQPQTLVAGHPRAPPPSWVWTSIPMPR